MKKIRRLVSVLTVLIIGNSYAGSMELFSNDFSSAIWNLRGGSVHPSLGINYSNNMPRNRSYNIVCEIQNPSYNEFPGSKPERPVWISVGVRETNYQISVNGVQSASHQYWIDREKSKFEMRVTVRDSKSFSFSISDNDVWIHVTNCTATILPIFNY